MPPRAECQYPKVHSRQFRNLPLRDGIGYPDPSRTLFTAEFRVRTVPDTDSPNDPTRDDAPLSERPLHFGPAPVFPSGTLIGRYQVVDVLGEGSFGIVHRAYDPVLDRLIAIKLPHDAWMPPEKQSAFLREARVAAAIFHRNICPVYDVGIQGGRPFIVMHLVVGPTLADVLQDRERRKAPFSTHDSAGIVGKLALGVAAAHAKKVTTATSNPRTCSSPTPRATFRSPIARC